MALNSMNRRDFLVKASQTAAFSCLANSPLAAQSQLAAPRNAVTRRPNILFIMSDDHAAHAISAYGSRINQTPHLDRLAHGGTRLNNCFCTNAICTPSRAAIMTGQYGHVNGVRGWENFDSRRPVQVQKLLQDAGYATAIVGKWHLGRGVSNLPQNNGAPPDKVPHDPAGFDYWEIVPGQGAYNDPQFYTAAGQKKYPGYVTDITTDLALEWLKNGRDKDKPFYLCVHHKAPHRNWVTPANYRTLFADRDVLQPETFNDDYAGRPAAEVAKMRVARDMTKTDTKGETPPETLSPTERANWYYQHYIKDYLRCVQSVDDSVGRLLDHLDQSGLSDDTIVIYTSDQGFFLGDHGWFDKRFFYEESLKMPFLMRYPGEVGAGSVSDMFLLNIDFAPTLLDYGGVPVPEAMQGVSGRAMLRGEPPRDWQAAMYYRYWVNGDEHNTAAHYGVRTATHKLIYFYSKPLGVQGATLLRPPCEPYWELFDLIADPHEMHNVYNAPQNAALIANLKTELARLQKKYNDVPQHAL